MNVAKQYTFLANEIQEAIENEELYEYFEDTLSFEYVVSPKRQYL